MDWKLVLKYDRETFMKVAMHVQRHMGHEYMKELFRGIKYGSDEDLPLIVQQEINEMNANMRAANLQKDDPDYERMMNYIQGLKEFFR